MRWDKWMAVQLTTRLNCIHSLHTRGPPRMANMTRAHSPTCNNTSGKAPPVHSRHLGKVADRLGVMKSKNPCGSTPHSEPRWMTDPDRPDPLTHLRLSVTKMTKEGQDVGEAGGKERSQAPFQVHSHHTNHSWRIGLTKIRCTMRR